MKQLDRPEIFDEAAFAVLESEIAAYVAGPAEEWAQRIERERRVPPELWDELRDRGYLSLAAPAEYGGRGIPFTQYLRLIELFSMSHASIRMIVHVVNGTWRAMDRFATPQQRRAFGHTISDFQAIQFMLADMATEIEAARCLVRQAAWKQDSGARFSREASIAKLFASELATRASHKAMQMRMHSPAGKRFPGAFSRTEARSLGL